MKLPRSRLLRPGESRATLAAFAFLGVFFASQAVLEAARDTLFLSRVPANHLPWMYIAIAILSFAVARGEERLGRRMDSANALVAWVTVSAVGTLVLGLVLRGSGATHDRTIGVYASYVWSGLVTSLVVARFWALLGGLFSIIDAKRLYGLIGAGSVVGAIVGSGVAGLTAYVAPPDTLLLVASAGFAASIAAAASLRRALGRSPPTASGERVKLLRALGMLRREGYPQRVMVLLVVAAGCLTVADYVFKSAVVVHVPREQLGVFFGGLGVVTNTLSLLVQVVVGPRLIASLGVSGALAVLPLALTLGGAGLAVGLSTAGAVAVRLSDGSLRYSLHRTAAELLFVPMAPALRGAMKVLDVLGQRCGQAVASVALLVLSSLGAPPLVFSLTLVTLSVVWASGAFELRRHYLDVFRSDLRSGRLRDSVALRGLDQAALETLIATLDSGEDAEVLAALSVLAREGKAHLVPALILYHPSMNVVWHAANLFVEKRRVGVVPTLDRLARHPSEDRRTVGVLTRATLAPDRTVLEAWRDAETSPQLRRVISFLLLRHGVGGEPEAKAIIEEVRADGSEGARAGLAAAIALDPSPTHDDFLLELAADDSAMMRQTMPRLLAVKGTPAAIKALVALVADERSREQSIRALVWRGDRGLKALLGALDDDGTPASIAWHIPRALTYFAPGLVLPRLLARMHAAPDGMLRYRCLRAIERLVALDPALELDRARVAAETRQTIERALWCLTQRVALRRGADEVPARRTEVQGLLVDLLGDKERHAVDRALRLLGLLQRGGDFADVRRGLASHEPRMRASAVELLGHVLPPELRTPVLGLVGAGSDAERLDAARADDDDDERTQGYDGTLAIILELHDANLSALAEYHRDELARREPVRAAPAALETTS